MFRARERGMSFWPFAISLVVLIVFIILWFSVSGERDDSRRMADAARNQAEAAKTELENFRRDFQQASRAVGFAEGGNYTKADAVQRGLKDMIAKCREKASLEIATFKYTAAEGGGQVEKTEGDRIKVTWLGLEGQGEPTSLEGVGAWVEQGFARMRADLERGVTTIAELQAQKDSMVKAQEEALKAKDERIAGLTSEKQAVETQMTAQTQELRDQKAELERQKDQLQSEIEQLKKQAAEDSAKLLAQVNEAQGQIRSLVHREAPTLTEGPDGEVLVGADGVVVVNRGKRQFLMPGTVFSVYGRAKGGALYPKGTVKVTVCDDETARCTVVEMASPTDPFVQGDLIQSPTYSPNRQLHFVLVGEFKKMGRSMLEARLKQLGAVIDDKVTAQTHYVVEGGPGPGQENLDETEAVKAAKELGIRILTEDQLVSFTKI